MEPRGTALQLAVMPREQRAQTPQEIWNGTTARWPGRTRLTRATDLEHLAHPLVPEREWAGERQAAEKAIAAERARKMVAQEVQCAALERRKPEEDPRVQIAACHGEGAHERVGVGLEPGRRNVPPFEAAGPDEGELPHTGERAPLVAVSDLSRATVSGRAFAGEPEPNGGSGSYSIPSWIALATSSPAIRAASRSAMSIPAETPAAVITLPCTTTRRAAGATVR